MYRLACSGRIDISHHRTEVSLANFHVELLLRCAYGFVNHLVDSHLDSTAVLQNQRVAASFQRSGDNGLAPVVDGNLLDIHGQGRTIDSSLDIACLAAVTVADADVVFASGNLRQFQGMAQGTARVGLCLDESQTGKVRVFLCPPA